MLTWRHVVPEDFPLLARWLAAPHVARWWNHEASLEAVERDFGPSTRREEPNEDLLALVDQHGIVKAGQHCPAAAVTYRCRCRRGRGRRR
jgi:hypothetical protein